MNLALCSIYVELFMKVQNCSKVTSQFTFPATMYESSSFFMSSQTEGVNSHSLVHTLNALSGLHLAKAKARS